MMWALQVTTVHLDFIGRSQAVAAVRRWTRSVWRVWIFTTLMSFLYGKHVGVDCRDLIVQWLWQEWHVTWQEDPSGEVSWERERILVMLEANKFALVSLFDQLETKKDISGRQWLSCVNLCGWKETAQKHKWLSGSSNCFHSSLYT